MEYIRAYVKSLKNSKGDFQQNLLASFNRPEIEYIDVPETDPALVGLFGGMAETASTEPHSPKSINQKVEALKKEKQKVERALSRLDDAYYFADDLAVITKSEYGIKKEELKQKLDKVDGEISSLSKQMSLPAATINIDLISRFLLIQNLYTADNIKDILNILDKNVVQDFLQQVIEFIEVANGKVTKIGFKSSYGIITHQFVYK